MFSSFSEQAPRATASETSKTAPAARLISADDCLAGADRGEDSLGDGFAGEADLLPQQRRLAVRHVPIRQADAHDRGACLLPSGEGLLYVLEHSGTEAA